jgi:ribonuclease P protein component
MHGLSTRARLHQTREFQRVYQRGTRAAGEWITVVLMRQATPRGTRLGVSVSKDNGSAVCRNKIKRLLREAFRLERNSLPADLDIVLIPRPREEAVPLAALRQELQHLCARALDSKRRPDHRRSDRSKPEARGGKSKPEVRRTKAPRDQR